MTWPFGHLRPLSYAVALVDPAWLFKNRSAKGEKKNPNQHYPCMPMADIAALPVGQLMQRDAVCAMWATSPLLDQQIAVLKGWGFAYKAFVPWAKQARGEPKPGEQRKWAFGGGYIFRNAAEILLVGTMGEPKRLSRSIRNLLVAPVREHSRKPDQIYPMLETLFAGPYCELFARQQRPGWDAWGNDVDHFPAR